MHNAVTGQIAGGLWRQWELFAHVLELTPCRVELYREQACSTHPLIIKQLHEACCAARTP